jgi:hypothetical protein
MTAREMVHLLLEDQVRVETDLRALLKGGGFFEWWVNQPDTYLIGLADAEATDHRALVTALHEALHASRCLAGAAPYQLEMHELKLWARFREELVVHWGSHRVLWGLRRHGKVSRSLQLFNAAFSLYALTASCPLIAIPALILSVLLGVALVRCPLTRKAWTAYCCRKYGRMAEAMQADPAYAPLINMMSAPK